jgi:peptide/nickel transport system substrate-binding protein
VYCTGGETLRGTLKDKIWPHRAGAQGAGCRAPLVALALAVLLGLVAPERASAAERGQGGTLRLLFWQAPTIINPHLSIGTKDLSASRIVYEPLASFDKDGRLIPLLASEIPSRENGGVPADGRSVTWKLKQGIKWADGAPFTADDVRFTFQYASNPAVGTTTSATYDVVRDVQVIDDHAVTVHFKGPNPAWALPFVGVNGMIIPRHLFQDYNGANAQESPNNLLAVGTGAFRVRAFEEEDILIIGDDAVSTIKITYQPNPHFREPDKPFFGTVELRGGGDALTAAVAVLKEGTIDYGYNLQVAIDTLEELEGHGKGKLLAPASAWVERIMINFTDPNRETPDDERSSLEFAHPFFSDKRVRQALSLAVDRAAIA